MTGLAVLCAILVPRVNVNSNMTRYLPDDYPMTRGMLIVESELPAIQQQMQEFGGVFADGEDLMPTNLPRTLLIGVILVFVVLLLMSSSVMEVPLFLITVGFAVVLNMGTNALLDSVSMMTNTLSPVLQMVLSMDYSIILMNRYRQEKMRGKLPVPAMESAVEGAMDSILSSAFTTIVSLLMLCFIKLKIGADLGIVLAKGVAFSLLCNFTVLPTLIIWGDKGVEATRKKVPVLPSAALSRFLNRFRVPVAILFLAVFVAFAWLQRRTALCFAPQWDSNVSELQTGENALMLIYSNDEENAIPPLLDAISLDPLVHQTLSYPSLVNRPRTVEDLLHLADDFAGQGEFPDIPEDLLHLVYYAHSHPERTETFSLKELQATADELSALGLVPEGFRPDQLMKSFLPKAPAIPAKPSRPLPPVAPVVPETTEAEPVAAQEDTLQIEQIGPVIPDVLPEELPEDPGPLTYEIIHTPYTSAEMADLLESDASQIATVYRLAGKRRGKMTLVEFTDYVRNHILNNRVYAAFVPKGMEEQMAQLEEVLADIEAAGPTLIAETSETPLEDTPSLEEPGIAEDILIEAADTLHNEAAPVLPVPDLKSPAPTPQERLLDMYLSSRRYTSARMYSALSAAGIPVTRDQLDLLYLYAGAKRDYDPETAIAPGVLLDYLADTLLTHPALAGFVPDSTRALVADARGQLFSGVGMLHGNSHSAAVVLSGYEVESDSTFAFVERLRATAGETLQKPHYWVGESEMYKLLKDGFPRELLLLTLLTVLAIFLIVALTFRSLLVPVPLVMTIMAGIYANVWASGLGGNSMYYLSYLIIQGILMGATIDYSILFTSYYLSARKTTDIPGALEGGYKGSSHSILTSGLILSIVPFVLSFTMDDPMIASILKSLAFGAFAILLLILFLLPAVLAALDPLLRKR